MESCTFQEGWQKKIIKNNVRRTSTRTVFHLHHIVKYRFTKLGGDATSAEADNITRCERWTD